MIDKSEAARLALNDASNKLQEAISLFESADETYRSASRERTAATNRLNDAQKKFDEVVGEIRKAAPRESNWKSVMGLPA